MLTNFLSKLQENNRSEEKISILRKTSFDYDGVISDSRVAAVSEFNKRFGTDHSHHEIIEWFALKSWAINLGLSEEEATKVEDDIWSNEDILLKSPPMDGAYATLYGSHKLGILSPIITSRPPHLKDATIKHAKENFDFMKPFQIKIRRDELIDGIEFKAKVINELGIVLHIDDAITHTAGVLEKTNASVILLSNDDSLDYLNGDAKMAGRYLRIAGSNGHRPDMIPVYNLFFA